MSTGVFTSEQLIHDAQTCKHQGARNIGDLSAWCPKCGAMATEEDGDIGEWMYPKYHNRKGEEIRVRIDMPISTRNKLVRLLKAVKAFEAGDGDELTLDDRNYCVVGLDVANELHYAAEDYLSAIGNDIEGAFSFKKKGE